MRENSAPPNAQRAVDTLRKVLIEIGWEPQEDDQTASFVVDLGPPHLPVASAFAAISTDLEQFVFFVNFGLAVASGRRDEVAKLIARVNWDLTVGNFEIDYEDGHLRFKSSVNFRNAELSEMLIRNTILSAMNAVERYADALVAVAAGEKSVEQAIKDVEGNVN
jgi:hypothetical protein